MAFQDSPLENCDGLAILANSQLVGKMVRMFCSHLLITKVTDLTFHFLIIEEGKMDWDFLSKLEDYERSE